MANYFEKFAQEGNEYINQLAADLGHPEEKGQTYILLRAVLHTIRDRIAISESFHVLSQLPMFLKALYTEHWQYREQPLQFESLEEFKDAVKQEQARHGEQQFNWSQSTEDLIAVVLTSLSMHYLTEGQLQHIATQMPADIKPLFPAAPERHRG
ncbi:MULTISPECIES: DUF2267 domain-containing protein [Pontibacter]|uniref:Uncharacterized conserved protein, DUF2267 family n=1 Tax=Pontibacter lucknowensis TaxID=1077936 RepID=A0A1N6VYD5_9BACT|nr:MULTISPECIES: DUF2267 domain-containing protein [Pontibacter]EJF08583.1 hypothetical protein O71_19982 [Pontibacter sp. BAB1700]SIQ82830.1 Uncharacterized conserved protein, DUF2267 family [Pontibacter lucknowensis]